MNHLKASKYKYLTTKYNQRLNEIKTNFHLWRIHVSLRGEVTRMMTKTNVDDENQTLLNRNKLHDKNWRKKQSILRRE